MKNKFDFLALKMENEKLKVENKLLKTQNEEMTKNCVPRQELEEGESNASKMIKVCWKTLKRL